MTRHSKEELLASCLRGLIASSHFPERGFLYVYGDRSILAGMHCTAGCRHVRMAARESMRVRSWGLYTWLSAKTCNLELLWGLFGSQSLGHTSSDVTLLGRLGLVSEGGRHPTAGALVSSLHMSEECSQLVNHLLL